MLCRVLIYILLLLISAACQEDSASPDSIWQKINDGALVIDVRTQSEYDAGHLQGALHIPYTQIGDTIAFIEPDTNRVIVLYCKGGFRSGMAENTLKNLGYINAVNGGGFEKLRKTKAKIDSCIVR
jgi:phage shock protein E